MHHAIRGDDGITEKLIGKGGSQILTVKNLRGAMLDGVRVLSITIEGAGTAIQHMTNPKT